MPKVLRVSFSDTTPEGSVNVILQEGTLVLDTADSFKTKITLATYVVQLPKELLGAVEPDELTRR